MAQWVKDEAEDPSLIFRSHIKKQIGRHASLAAALIRGDKGQKTGASI